MEKKTKAERAREDVGLVGGGAEPFPAETDHLLVVVPDCEILEISISEPSQGGLSTVCALGYIVRPSGRGEYLVPNHYTDP